MSDLHNLFVDFNIESRNLLYYYYFLLTLAVASFKFDI